MTKQIPLTQGLFATVDNDMYDYLMQWKWQAIKRGKLFHAIRTERKLFSKKTIYMHRVIMNTPDGMDVDHIDGNGLNNTRANLRNCTRAQNSRNSGKQSNNNSGYVGVTWHRHHQRWVANIGINGKRVCLGYFVEIEDAARAYDQAAKEYFGEFANTNF
jgi:hypothetical protein